MSAQSETLGSGPFRSLAELRLAHAMLMRESRKLAGAASPDQVADFIKRATAVGALIENQDDRDSAQGVIDYWAAWQFAPGRGMPVPATPPTLDEFVPAESTQKKSDINPYVGLRAFDELEVGAVILNEAPSFRIDHMPYGGVKDSGFGREGIRSAIEDMSEPRLLITGTLS